MATLLNDQPCKTWLGLQLPDVLLFGASVPPEIRQEISNLVASSDENTRKMTEFATREAGGGCMEERNSGGVAVGDLNGDGVDDMVFTRLHAQPVLYLGRGDGTFDAKAPAQSGLIMPQLPVDHPARNLSSFRPSVPKGSSGVVLVDVDNDGDEDVYITSMGGAHHGLFMNDGRGVFTEEAAARGATGRLAGDTGLSSGGAVGVADYDNDGWLDLYVTEWRLILHSDVFSSPVWRQSNSVLLRNTGGGHFEDVTDAAGLQLTGKAGALILAREEASAGTDSGHTSEAAAGQVESTDGIGNGIFSFSPVWRDFSGDGQVDLMVVGDFGSSALFLNNGDGTFRDASLGHGFGYEENGMGACSWDLQGRGVPSDTFVTAIHARHKTAANGKRRIPNTGYGLRGNELYLARDKWRSPAAMQSFMQSRGVQFPGMEEKLTGALLEGPWTMLANATDTVGVRPTNWAWGCAFVDLGNTGVPTLLVTNGYSLPESTVDDFQDWEATENNAFCPAGASNRPALPVSASLPAGVADAQGLLSQTWTACEEDVGFDSSRYGRGVAVADFDGDGALDVVVANYAAPPALLHNSAGPRDGAHWLRVHVRQGWGARYSVGALVAVRVTGAGGTVRGVTGYTVGGSTHFTGQSAPWVHAGVGALSEGDVVDVFVGWRDAGCVVHVSGLGAGDVDQHLHIVPACKPCQGGVPCCAARLQYSVSATGEAPPESLTPATAGGAATGPLCSDAFHLALLQFGQGSAVPGATHVPVASCSRGDAVPQESDHPEHCMLRRSANVTAAYVQRPVALDAALGLAGTVQPTAEGMPAAKQPATLQEHVNSSEETAKPQGGAGNASGDTSAAADIPPAQGAMYALPVPPPLTRLMLRRALKRLQGAHKDTQLDGQGHSHTSKAGEAHAMLRRVLPAAYPDGVSAPAGSHRPSPRNITRTMHQQLWGREDTHTDHVRTQQDAGGCGGGAAVNGFFTHFGQFLAHELSHSTPQANVAHEEYMPISVAGDDPSAVTALKIRRSMWARDTGGQRQQLNHQTAWLDASAVYGASSGVSAALRSGEGGRLLSGEEGGAGSGGEGGTPAPPAWLRQSKALARCLSGSGGEAGGSMGLPLNGGNMVPTDNPVSRVGGCLMASGDARGNAQLGLTSVHSLMVRAHNWLATALAHQLQDEAENGTELPYALRVTMQGTTPAAAGKVDDAVFHTVREVLASALQMWTYHEYLPKLLGQQWYSARLGGCASGDASRCILSRGGVDSAAPVGIANDFSTGAFRFGHAQAPEKLPLDVDGCVGRGASSEATCPHIRLSDAYFVELGSRLPAHGAGSEAGTAAQQALAYGGGQGGDVWRDVYTRVLRGSLGHASRPVCGTFAPSMHHALFGRHSAGGLVDMPAINVQRGRDHGLPSYGEYARWGQARWGAVLAAAAAGGSGSNGTLAEGSMPELLPGGAAALRAAYGDAAVSSGDVDMYAAGVLEVPVAGGQVGPTFAALIDEQFVALAGGDAQLHTRVWSNEELSVLWKSLSLRRVFCALAVPHEPAARAGGALLPSHEVMHDLCVKGQGKSLFDVL